MPAIVIDASVAVKWQVREILTEQARTLLMTDEPLIAPDWLLVEAASTYWKKVRRSELLEIHALRHLEDLPLFFTELHPSHELIDAAMKWSFRLRHSVYDCLYLALAERERASLITADKKFFEVVEEGALFDRIRLLS